MVDVPFELQQVTIPYPFVARDCPIQKKSTAGNVPAVFLLIPGAQSMMPLGKRSRGGCLVEVWPAWPSQRTLISRWIHWTQGVIELVQQPHICSSESSWRSMCFQECWPMLAYWVMFVVISIVYHVYPLLDDYRQILAPSQTLQV